MNESTGWAANFRKQSGGEGGTRNRLAILECVRYRLLVAGVPEIAVIAGAAWPMLAHRGEQRECCSRCCSPKIVIPVPLQKPVKMLSQKIDVFELAFP